MSDGVKPLAASDGSRGSRGERAAVKASAPSAQSAAAITPRPTSVLDQLEGVGPHLAEALRKHFRGDAGFLAAIQRLDVAALSAVDGVSERKAVDLIRQVQGLDRHGAELLATPAARKVHDELLDKLLAYACTAHGKNRLRLLAPHPTQASAEAAARKVMTHADAADLVDRAEVRKLLRRIHRPADPAPRFESGRMVLADDDAYPRLQKAGVQRWAGLGTLRDLERSGGHDLVVVVAERELDLAAYENAIDAPAEATLDDVVPEATLAWFETQRGALEAAAGLAQLTGRPSQAANVLAVLGAKAAPPIDARGLAKAVETTRGELDALLRERVTGLNLSGVEVLEALGKRLPGPLQKAMDDVLAEGRKRLLERTGHDLQPFTAGFPITIDDTEVERVTARIESRGRLDAFQDAVKRAKRLAALRPAVEAELARWLDFDADFALGCFALEHGLRPARLASHLEFTSSVHLDLAADPSAQRIAYRLGPEDNVAVLTGANSGGKTTLLEHIAQLVIMARLGLPVVGDNVTVPWVEELHYVTARRSLDAGAFESFLKSFLPVALGDKPRLVLADEVESVTELEAAGRILGFFVDRLARSPGSLAVVVSHMASEVLRFATAPVRVDGIEATGLDEQFRLVVDRSPVMGRFARSTPELILQRLAATAKGPQQGLYQDLLGLFAAKATPSRKGKR